MRQCFVCEIVPAHELVDATVVSSVRVLAHELWMRQVHFEQRHAWNTSLHIIPVVSHLVPRDEAM